MKLIIVSILMGMAVAVTPADTVERSIPSVTDVYARMEAPGDITEDSDMTLSASDDELGDSDTGQDAEEEVKSDKALSEADSEADSLAYPDENSIKETAGAVVFDQDPAMGVPAGNNGHEEGAKGAGQVQPGSNPLPDVQDTDPDNSSIDTAGTDFKQIVSTEGSIKLSTAGEMTVGPENSDVLREEDSVQELLSDMDSGSPVAAVADEPIEDGAADELTDPDTDNLTAELQPGWNEIDGVKYYCEEGRAVTGFASIDGVVYHFGEDGSLTVGLADIDGSSYYFGPDGKMRTGFVNIAPDQYYFDSEGKMVTGWQKINGFRYNMGEDGKILTGWQTIDNKNYYFYPKTDRAKKQYKGTAATGFFNWETDQYYFNAANEMTLGWQIINGFRYNMGTEGKILLGWQTIDDSKYYFYPKTDKTKKQYKGTAARGFFNWDKAQYYFDASSAMTLGWQKINGFRYNMGTDGKIRTGWQTIDGKTYYFYPVTESARGHYKGTAAVGHTMIGDKLCYFQNDGVKSSKMPSMTLTAIDYKKIDYYGDVTLLYSGGKYLLIDTGTEDNGPRYVINYLKKRGIRKFDIYISHYHDDHIGNINNILKDSYFTVGTIYMPDHSYMENQPGDGFSKYNKIYNNYIKTANAKGVKKVYLRQGSTFTIGDCTAKVLYMEGKARLKEEQPVGDAKKIKDRNIKYVNNRSLVTMFTCGEIRYLNCGDIEYEVEKRILDKKIDIKADIFKLNHHAGNTSNAGPFQKAVNAKYVYHTNPDCAQGIGNGKGNAYNWVREPVSKAVARSNVYAPRFNGNTSFTVSKGQITVNPERNYTNVTVKGKNMVTDAIKSFTMKIAKGTKYIMTNLSLPVAYKLN